MRIACLEIENFRGVQTAKVRLSQHNVFVGPNNSGKTTIMEALALLFGRDRLLRTLTEYDFHGGDPNEAARIKLVATIADFGTSDPTDQPDWFRMGRAVPKWLDELTGDLHASCDDPAWKLACQVAYCARFDRELLEVVALRYFLDDDEVWLDPFVDEAALSLFPSQLVRELGFLLAPASRSWDRIISFGSELFKRVVTSAGGKPSQSVLLARDSLRNPQNALEDDTHLKSLVTDLNAEMAGFFLDSPSLRLRVTSTDTDGVLDAVVPHYSTLSSGLALPARRQGNGLISLQWLLLLLELGRKRADQGLTFLMALEEPELHIPPPQQKRLVRRIQALSAQTFVSTHSPTVAAMADPATLSLVRNDKGNLSAVSLHVTTPAHKTSNCARSLFYSRRHETVSALMHDAVLVPEGYYDYVLLQLLSRAVDTGGDWNPDEGSIFTTYVGIVPTHDAAVAQTAAEILRLHPRVSALVDGDLAGQQYTASLTSITEPKLYSVSRWSNDWTIEDVIGWLLGADPTNALAHVQSQLQSPPSSLADLVSCLKSKERSSGGLKGDLIVYEVVSGIVASNVEIRKRARDLLNNLAYLCIGEPAPMFQASADVAGTTVFTP